MRESARALVRAPVGYAALLFLWMTVALYADGHGPRLTQTIVSVVTWALLAGVLLVVDAEERRQIIACVVIATGLEILFSIVWGLYIYRFDNLPLYVPPGHGLVYLLALRLSALPLIARDRRRTAAAVSLVAGAWTVVALVAADRPDHVGAALFPILLAFLWRSPRTHVFAGAFVATTVLELLGTRFGTWRWQDVVPYVGASQANPPSAIAAGYCLLDAAVIYATSRFPWNRLQLRRTGSAARVTG